MKLDGRVAIVTGASSGLGRDLCFRLISKNCKLILADIDADHGQKVCDELNQLMPNSAVFQQCNVVVKQEMEKLFEIAMEKFGRVDVMVNNAGIGENGDFLHELDTWKSVVDIDVNSVILGTKLAINHFLKVGTGGVIVNTASLAGLGPVPLAPVYAGAKAFVVNFTRSLAHFSKQGIRVNCICPSFVKTQLTMSINQKNFDFKIRNWVPISLVTDAFMLAIENDEMAGEALRVTFQNKIDFPFSNKRAKM